MSNEDVIQEDIASILRALGVGDHARPVSCHEVVHGEILPSISRLRERVEELERTWGMVEPREKKAMQERIAALEADCGRFRSQNTSLFERIAALEAEGESSGMVLAEMNELNIGLARRINQLTEAAEAAKGQCCCGAKSTLEAVLRESGEAK